MNEDISLNEQFDIAGQSYWNYWSVFLTADNKITQLREVFAARDLREFLRLYLNATDLSELSPVRFRHIHSIQRYQLSRFSRNKATYEPVAIYSRAVITKVMYYPSWLPDW